ncbi:MAG: hypothetical protein ACKON9_00950, partial [Planctomycetaceae bacterium]
RSREGKRKGRGVTVFQSAVSPTHTTHKMLNREIKSREADYAAPHGARGQTGETAGLEIALCRFG